MDFTKNDLRKLQYNDLLNLIKTYLDSNSTFAVTLRDTGNTSIIIEIIDEYMEIIMVNNGKIRQVIEEIERRHIP